MLEKIIEEALHSYQYGTLTNDELGAIQKIVTHAMTELGKEDGKPRNYDVEVDVIFKEAVQK